MTYSETKLIGFLKSFSNGELKEFERFLQSPFHKKSRDVMPLFKILEGFHPEFTSEKLNEEYIFRHLHPGSEFSPKKSTDIVRTLSSVLLKCTEDFLFISSVQSKKVLKNRILLTESLDRNLLKYYSQYFQIANDDLKEEEKSFGTDSLEKFYLERLNARYFSNVLDFRKYLESTIRAEEFISAYFWIGILRTSKTIYLKRLNEDLKFEKNEENIVDKILNAVNMEDVLQIYEGSKEYVFMCFNYYILKCLKENLNTKHFDKAKDIFYNNKESLSRLDKNFFYADLLNILMSKNSILKLENGREAFDIMKSCLKDKAYKISEDDFMQPDFYRNVVLMGNKLKEYDWIQNFIDEYSDELNPKYSENIKMYAMAVAHFSKGDFEQSLECITKVKYELAHFKIDVKILMLKIFYELKLYEQAYSLVDTFKHFLRNTKMPDEVRLSYSNFLKYYLKVCNQNLKETDFLQLKEEIKNTRNVSHKTWLVEKINVL